MCTYLSSRFRGYSALASPEQAKEYAGKMIGARLITKQTGSKGRICNTVSLSSAFSVVVA